MAPYKIISLDESGKPAYSHASREFALTGVIVDEAIKRRLSTNLIRLKKKFFNDENSVLHYKQLSSKYGAFKVLRDKETEIKFWSDLLAILNKPKITYLFTIVDKSEAKKKGWLGKTIVQKSYAEIIKMFLRYLKGQNKKGKIITESEAFQDRYLIKAHNNYQSMGIPALKISGKKYNEMITSLSLVNKKNLDPELQLADLLGTTIRLRYRIRKLNSKEKISKVEKNKLRLIERKIEKKTAKMKLII